MQWGRVIKERDGNVLGEALRRLKEYFGELRNEGKERGEDR